MTFAAHGYLGEPTHALGRHEAVVLGQHPQARVLRGDRLSSDVIEATLPARKVSGWPRRCKLAHAFQWECSDTRLKLAQLLGRHGVFLTWVRSSACTPSQLSVRPGRGRRSHSDAASHTYGEPRMEYTYEGLVRFGAQSNQALVLVCWAAPEGRDRPRLVRPSPETEKSRASCPQGCDHHDTTSRDL
jgi:hypothetical protein